MKINFALIGVLLVFAACQQGTRNTQTPPSFFDLKGYMEQQIKANEQYSTIQKTVSIDGEEESKKLSEIDWKADLTAFSRADINKPAWLEKYRVDTLSDKGMKIVYTAMEDKLITRKMTVSFANDAVDEIIIEQQNHNEVYTADKRLIYQSQKGYSMQTKQKAPFSEARDYEVRVVFLK